MIVHEYYNIRLRYQSINKWIHPPRTPREIVVVVFAISIDPRIIHIEQALNYALVA